jgi:hypothetical protein
MLGKSPSAVSAPAHKRPHPMPVHADSSSDVAGPGRTPAAVTGVRFFRVAVHRAPGPLPGQRVSIGLRIGALATHPRAVVHAAKLRVFPAARKRRGQLRAESAHAATPPRPKSSWCAHGVPAIRARLTELTPVTLASRLFAVSACDPRSRGESGLQARSPLSLLESRRAHCMRSAAHVSAVKPSAWGEGLSSFRWARDASALRSSSARR